MKKKYWQYRQLELRRFGKNFWKTQRFMTSR